MRPGQHNLWMHTMTHSPFPPLTNSQRSRLKTTLRNTPGIKEACADMGIPADLKNATIPHQEELCRRLGVNPQAAIDASNQEALDSALVEMNAEYTADQAQAAQVDKAAQAVAVLENDQGDLYLVEQEPQAPAQAFDLDKAASQVVAPFEALLHPSITAEIKASVSAMAAQAAQAIATAQKQAQAALDKAASQVAAQAAQVTPTALSAAREAKKSLGRIFGIKGQWGSAEVTTWAPCKDTPRIDPSYHFDNTTLGLVATAVDRGTGVWMHGPKGSGKTELARNIAAYLGRPFTRIGFSADMNKYSLLGQELPAKTGEWLWRDSVFAQAIQKPGNLILLDEPSFADPGLLAMFQTCLDTRSLTIEDTGQVIHFADGVCVICADNTAGFGDPTDTYGGTQPMNVAFLDRFPRKVEMTIPSNAVLESIIHARTTLPRPAAAILANLITTSEAMRSTGKLVTGLSLRPVLVFAADLVAGLPVKPCMDATLFASLPPKESEALRQHVQAQIDPVLLRDLALGKVPQAAQAPDLSSII